MPIKIYKRNTAGRRNMTISKPRNLTDGKPEKSLLTSFKSMVGRSRGKISVRHRGGGVKRKYRIVDFKVDKWGVPGKVASIEKDPFRNALIALVNYADGEKRYIIATKGMKKGEQIIAEHGAPIREGNRLLLKNVPVGTEVCCVEMSAGKGAQLARSAGSAVLLQAIDQGMASLKLPSGEIRMVEENCSATVGRVSNLQYNSMRIGKAGRKRHMGRRPHVRGTAMNPIDHPHGGGEGCQPIGLKHPKTPWGKPALGKKTRKRKKYSDRFILSRRKKRR